MERLLTQFFFGSILRVRDTDEMLGKWEPEMKHFRFFRIDREFELELDVVMESILELATYGAVEFPVESIHRRSHRNNDQGIHVNVVFKVFTPSTWKE